MKIGILTYYGVHSHGAVLQANALKKVLTEMGHEVCFITFERNYDFLPLSQVSKYKIALSSVSFYAKYLSEKGLKNIIYNLKKNNTLNKYRATNFKLGARYTEYKGDAVVIGSDEVFSLEIGINPWMYGHGIGCEKIITYAACFGPTTLNDIKRKHVEELVSSGLKKINFISTRDMNTKIIAEKLSGQSVTMVCDPVILYGYEKEMHLYKPKENNYILVYSYDKNMNDDLEIKQIMKYAKKYNRKVLSVGYQHSWCDKNINVNPNELLGYIRNAKAVITDTFHGAVLSIICNCEFVVKLRNNHNKLAFLMKEYDLTERIIREFSELENVFNQKINYDEVNKLIMKKRKESVEYLNKALQYEE